ncbi:hypothetical protein B9Z55_024561 [Caenorhabditis nigoni]|uniref:Uncharacterized protein n=2 Tax=Caenorhabditis nigoni TaxID=1611254 RepID=A0A2G5SUJ9_9PELO|nr:hypothetical protein B9Z55_024561 [Caenorhabditis nigoni]
MFNYPFPRPTIEYPNYKFDMSINMINKVLFQTVMISFKVNLILHYICLGIICPLTTILSTYIGYHSFKVAYMLHVRKLETTFACFAMGELIGMQYVTAIFAVFYWTFGYFTKEDEVGTSKVVCIFYLYSFQYIPGFLFNLSNCTVAMMFLMYFRKTHPTLLGMKLNNFNLRTCYVVIVNGALLDVLFIFCISWIAMAKSGDELKYQHKCFVLLNPIFHKVGIVNLMKGVEWETQIFSHTIPYILTILYMVLAMYKILQHHMNQRNGVGLQLKEKLHFGGCALTFGITIIFMCLDVVFQLFCDIYEISLHYTTEPTNQEFFFFLKNAKTVMRTISYVLAPFQLLSLCTLNPDFQHTMVRHLNGTTHFEVLVQTTLGGEKRKKVLYEKLPKISEMKFAARLYYRWCRCHIAVKLFNKLIDWWENTKREVRQNRRHRRENRKITRERRLKAKQLAESKAGGSKTEGETDNLVKKDSRIEMDPVVKTERFSVSSSNSWELRETTV